DEDGRVVVLCDCLERLAETGPLEEPDTQRGEPEGGRCDEDRSRLDRRAADVPEATRAESPKGQRIRKDVGGPVEEDQEERPDRERHRERGADPADRGAARAVRLDREK